MIERNIWIAMVAKLCCPQDAAGAARSLMAYLPMLADFPPPAFTTQSAEAVARQNRFTPSYAQLRDALADWWRDNQPHHRQIGRDKPEGWTEIDETWLTYWRRRDAECFAPVPNMIKPPGGYTWREHVASMVRTYSLKAWSVIEREQRT